MTLQRNRNAEEFVVIHPLDDVAEIKLDPRGRGRMPLTRGVRISLLVLRGYLAVLAALVVYHVFVLAQLLP
jgi:hypothetical protein